MADHRFTSDFAVDRNPTEAFDGSKEIEGCSVAIRHRTDPAPAPRTAAMTSGSTAATAAALTATLGLAAASWVVAVWQMNGMDMGAATELGSFGFFAALWVSMMAAMMLPGAAPAVVRHVRASRSCAHRAAVRRVLPCRLGTRGRRGVRGVPAARVCRRRRGCDRGRCLRVHAAQAALPPALPRERPLRIRVRALLRRLEHRADADAGGAGRHERHLDGRDRRPRPRPEAAAREGRHRCAAGAGDRRTRCLDRRRALVGSRTHAHRCERHLRTAEGDNR